MRYVNATPHRITLTRPDGTELTLARSKEPARVKTSMGDQVDTVSGVPIHGPASYHGIENLPPYTHDALVIVSQITALAIAALHPDRDDIVYPASSHKDGAVRDNAARVVSVSRLIRAA